MLCFARRGGVVCSGAMGSGSSKAKQSGEVAAATDRAAAMKIESDARLNAAKVDLEARKLAAAHEAEVAAAEKDAELQHLAKKVARRLSRSLPSRVPLVRLARGASRSLRRQRLPLPLICLLAAATAAARVGAAGGGASTAGRGGKRIRSRRCPHGFKPRRVVPAGHSVGRCSLRPRMRAPR